MSILPDTLSLEGRGIKGEGEIPATEHKKVAAILIRQRLLQRLEFSI
jgi:hypothetical protein